MAQSAERKNAGGGRRETEQGACRAGRGTAGGRRSDDAGRIPEAMAESRGAVGASTNGGILQEHGRAASRAGAGAHGAGAADSAASGDADGGEARGGIVTGDGAADQGDAARGARMRGKLGAGDAQRRGIESRAGGGGWAASGDDGAAGSAISESCGGQPELRAVCDRARVGDPRRGNPGADAGRL